MRTGLCLATALLCCWQGSTAVGQGQPEGPAQSKRPALLATGHLASVVELPLYFRLYLAHLPAAQHASYQGSAAMLYELSGATAMDIDGAAAQPLAEGEGAFIAAGQAVTINADASVPADLLVFVLTAGPNLRRPLFERPAIAREVYRTPDPLPGLKPGPYEFSLARLTLPAEMPADPAHYRSGVALDYVLDGAGTVTADGNTEAMPTGMALIEGVGWVHSLANPGETPLVILEASINREGDPAVVPATPK